MESPLGRIIQALKKPFAKKSQSVPISQPMAPNVIQRSKIPRKLIIFIVIAICLAPILVGFLDARNKAVNSDTSNNNSNLSVTVTASPIGEQNPTSTGVSATITPTVYKVSYKDEGILKDISENDVKVCSIAGSCTVDVVFENYAKGTMPQAWWMANIIEGKWKVVLSGNGIPNCVDIEKNAIPEEIYINCIEDEGGLRY